MGKLITGEVNLPLTPAGNGVSITSDQSAVPLLWPEKRTDINVQENKKGCGPQKSTNKQT
ncbi:hypothetical protein K070079E91_34160 [Eisenbergiella porci]